MTPILVRPVREQLEHDRIIRQLQARWRRRYDVAVNLGDEKTASVRIGTAILHPDLILNSPERGRRLLGVVEVETAESVNNLEAMAQWAHFGRSRAPFYLYVPSGAVDQARRLCENNQVDVAEIWSYHPVGDQIRFTLVHRASPPPASRTAAQRRARAVTAPRKKAAGAAAKRTSRAAARTPARAAVRKSRPQRRK